MNIEPIGGYFSLELPLYEEYHKHALRLNTGRNCLEYILRVQSYTKVYIPYYTCDVVLEPFLKLGVPYEYYHINIHLELAEEVQLGENEALLYTNYFGLKQRYTEKLAQQYGRQLIVDNTQAFYSKRIDGIDTFYTCRKYFGVPDGAYLYIDEELDEESEQDVSWDRMTFLSKRLDLGAEAGYGAFKELSQSLSMQPIRKMSRLTERLMKSIDYQIIAQRRRENYSYLHEHLATTNHLQLTMDDEAVPMVYPYLSQSGGLRDKLIENKVFVARYWPNVLEWAERNDLEYRLTLQTQYLPVDQRYGMRDMERIIRCINE